MVTNRKIIITLKESILNGAGTTNKIYCDAVWVDQLSSPQLVNYQVNGVYLNLPIHNFLGSHLNENYKPNGN